MPRLPAEWEQQAAVLLTWPHPGTDWAAQLPAVEAVYRRIAAHIAARQGLLVVCRDPSHRDRVRAQLASAGVAPGAAALAIAPSDDTWARDHGPITVLDDAGAARVVDFRFNGWGGKYPSAQDDLITARLHADGWLGGARLVPSPLVLEGGAIDTDGDGGLLVVRRTLLDPHRNPGWDQQGIEQELARQLGIRRCLWLDQGQLEGDDTDGHIDTLARFCGPDTICHITAHPAASDAERRSLAAMLDELRALRRADGMPYRLIALPAPRPISGADGAAQPASYANFLIINGAVLMPTYDDSADTIAAERLAAAFPGRSILPVNCRELIRQGGSLHCITMQLPAAIRTD
ncbi:MAG: agmatine deiminase family protein [Thiohalocapsa sp.]|jgi:agmatine/peptidylarginine deiminase|uniref:agmatine deiminase family protein n=1 Tax=Thiohalocapsa sp. TaxID=2497641 RepID=UPI0025FB8769|nr:agmatine deiminase family protein [Thiohalocapsa sp.]MCG6942902.1 agmatine deiminase family protein [Thiohalocapsa sp.]